MPTDRGTGIVTEGTSERHMTIAPPVRNECKLNRRGSSPTLTAVHFTALATSAVDTHDGRPFLFRYTATGILVDRCFYAWRRNKTPNTRHGNLCPDRNCILAVNSPPCCVFGPCCLTRTKYADVGSRVGAPVESRIYLKARSQAT